MEQAIKNIGVSVDEVYFKNNHLQQGEFTASPKLKRSISKDKSMGRYVVSMRAEFFTTEECAFPFDFAVSVAGVFEANYRPTGEKYSDKEIEEALKSFGVETVYPHLRATVAALTGISMVPSLLLPIVSPSQFKD